jgi:hypothetical protein
MGERVEQHVGRVRGIAVAAMLHAVRLRGRRRGLHGSLDQDGTAVQGHQQARDGEVPLMIQTAQVMDILGRRVSDGAGRS